METVSEKKLNYMPVLILVTNLLYLVLAPCLVDSYAVNQFETNITRELMKNYTAEEMPPSLPLNLSVGMKIMEMGGLNSRNPQFYISALIEFDWIDERLSFKHLAPNLTDSVDITFLMDKIWMPKLYFSNSLSITKQEHAQQNHQLELKSNGLIRRLERYGINLHCKMELDAYPFDTQHCSLKIETMSVANKHVNLAWSKHFMNKNIHLSDFHKPVIVDNRSCVPVVEFSSCVVTTFRLARVYEYYIFSVYIPFILLVSVSFAVFWIDVKVQPARTTLSIVGVMTCMVHLSNQQNNDEHSGRLRALDIYGVVCLTFTIISFIECHAAHYWQRTVVAERFAKKSKYNPSNNNQNLEIQEPEDSKSKKKSKSCPKCLLHKESTPNSDPTLDSISRIFMPTMFVLFNIIYWLFCILRFNNPNFEFDEENHTANSGM